MESKKEKSNWRAFWIGFVLIFTLTTFQLLGVKPSLVNPVPVKADIFDSVLKKLKGKPNTYRLHKESSIIPKTYAASSDYEQAKGYAVIDYENGNVILEKNLEKKLPIASLTKIMTAVVALDLADKDEYFTAPPYISSIVPTHIAMYEGEKMTLEELLHASLLTSANDATEVIKFGIDSKYKEAVFIRAMNEKATFLGLKSTSFTNPQGFDNPSHASSIKDLAILTHYALTNYPLIAEIVKKENWYLPGNMFHSEHILYNWNGLLGVYPGIFGVKIGNTEKAGKTTIVGAEREGKKILVVLLGADDIIERDLWSGELLDVGFSAQLSLPEINVTEEQLLAKYRKWQQ